MAKRDPETRRTIRRLELELHETRSIDSVIRILEKLVALYSELGDARGVIRCKTDLKRAEAISDRQERRKKRRGHRGRLPRPRLVVHRLKTEYPKVLWRSGDLALLELPDDHSVLLVQVHGERGEPIKAFGDEAEAREYVRRHYGRGGKSNDPSRRR